MKDFNQVRGNLLEMLEDLDLQLEKVTDEEKARLPDKSSHADSSKGSEKAINQLQDQVSDDMAKVQQIMSNIDDDIHAICLSCGRPIKRSDHSSSNVNQCKFCQESSGE